MHLIWKLRDVWLSRNRFQSCRLTCFCLQSPGSEQLTTGDVFQVFSPSTWKLWSRLRMPRGESWGSVFTINRSSFRCFVFSKVSCLPQFFTLLFLCQVKGKVMEGISISCFYFKKLIGKKNSLALKKSAQPDIFLSLYDSHFFFCLTVHLWAKH